MTLSYIEDSDHAIAEIRVSGRIDRAEFDRVVAQLQAFIDTHGTVKLVEVIDSFPGFDAHMLWEGMKFDMRNIPKISHVAVVSDIGWISPVSKAAGALVSTRLRTFGMDEIEDARTWLRDA